MAIQGEEKLRTNETLIEQPKFRHIAVASIVALFCIENATAEWQFDPTLRAAWDYDDNATLSVRTDDEEQISGLIGEASIDLRNVSENGSFSLRPMLRSRSYGSNSSRDSDDQFLNLRWGTAGERSDLRLFADYSRESVRTAELADADLDTEIDPDDISDDDSGRISSRERRERIRVGPRWAYRVSDVSSIEANIGFLTVDYADREQASTLFDYTDTKLQVSYKHDFSDRNTGVLTLTGRDYTTERPNGDRTGLGISTGFNRTLSETTRLRAMVGIEQTESENSGQAGSNEDPTFVTDISLVRNLETIRLLAQYRQRVAPSGRGVLSTRDEFNLRMTRDLNDKFTAGLSVRAYTIDSVGGGTTTQDFVQLRGQLLWRISQSISIQTDYRHTVLNREILGEGADSNRITVWFSYQPNGTGRNSRATMR